MRFLILFCSLLPVLVFAQTKPSRNITDSSAYYSQYVRDRYKQTFDSLKASPDVKAAQDRLKAISSRSDNYSSFNIYADVADADFDNLNSTLVPEGFSSLKNHVVRIGYGFTSKYDRIVFDFNLTTFGLNSKAKKEGEKVKGTFSNFLQFDFGYDVIRSQAINIYPFAGLSVRNMTLEYDKPKEVNSGYTDITNILRDDGSAYATAGGIGYQAGVGFDFVIGNNKDRTGGTMFFVKAGTNGIIGNPVYHLDDDIKYNPHIKYGQWIVTAGFKFFGRK